MCYSPRKSILSLIPFVVLLPLSAWSSPQGKIKDLGAGSYTVERPAGIKPLPTRIFKNENLRSVTPTNQWWSSLIWDTHSWNMFPHPLGAVCFEGGLAISYPGAAIVAAPEAIMGGGVSKNGDIVIGHSATNEFPDAKLADFSSWFVTAEFVRGQAKLQTSIGHGSPFVYCRITGGQPSISFAHAPQIWADNGNVLGVTVRGNHYGLFGARKSKWIPTNPKQLENQTKRDYFTVALLPDNSPKTLLSFAKLAHRHVTETEASFVIADGFLETSYQIESVAMEPSQKGTLFATYPHQWKYITNKLTNWEYESVRGTMKVVRGEGFQTRVPMQGVLPMLPPEGIQNKKKLVAILQAETSQASPSFADSYWEGKYLGKLASLSGVAEAAGEQELQQKLVSQIRTRLENWLTAAPQESAPLFYYDQNWKTLIGNKPSYGSDSELNDHHFHYGYFIRAAAEVARLDPSWATKWKPMVDLLVRDIAAPASDPMFPTLRCFDLYAGHSWASGTAKFGDGNNQESSSESLNAWYGITLWGEVTGDQELRDRGLFLFNTELTAVEEYWFDVAETNFPENYPNECVGMVWGGKGAFATWFSGDIDCIHGINWLPFTPASVYLGRHPKYVERSHKKIIRQRKTGSNYDSGWGDLVLMFGALNNADKAREYLAVTPDCKVENGNTRAFMYHWIHTLAAFGRIDSKIQSSYPFANVFSKGKTKSYVAYNFGKKPIKVNFSDGTTMTVSPKSISVHQK